MPSISTIPREYGTNLLPWELEITPWEPLTPTQMGGYINTPHGSSGSSGK